MKESILEFMKSYLFDRHHFVTIKKESSTKSKLFTGFPQSLTFGPLLFVLYINDFLSTQPNGSIFSYVNDITWIEVHKIINILNKFRVGYP